MNLRKGAATNAVQITINHSLYVPAGRNIGRNKRIQIRPIGTKRSFELTVPYLTARVHHYFRATNILSLTGHFFA